MLLSSHLRRNAHLVVCAAPPATAVAELVGLLLADDWTVQVVPTATAADWLDLPALEALTGNPIADRFRKPDERHRAGPPDLVIVAPASFNTINKWVAGINDNVALGLLNTTFGLRVPTIVSPYAKAALAAHPGFRRNLALLAEWGALVTERDALRPEHPDQPYRWNAIMNLLPVHLR
ncbi:flavoprotein [Catellatospora sp. NPDC049133]|uniref:flavoprotein n=1 Tax=Catellatospora sp. NPDC049133 TaxID=3155499 RepID=UPI0033C28397